MPSYTVTAYHGRGRPWAEDKPWGPLVPRRIELDGVDGIVEWSRKADAPDPQVGEQLTGDVEKTEYGFRFKKAKQNGGGFQKSPEQQKSIVRQHSQEMALRREANLIAAGKPGLDGSQLRELIDRFVKDAGS